MSSSDAAVGRNAVAPRRSPEAMPQRGSRRDRECSVQSRGQPLGLNRRSYVVGRVSGQQSPDRSASGYAARPWTMSSLLRLSHGARSVAQFCVRGRTGSIAVAAILTFWMSVPGSPSACLPSLLSWVTQSIGLGCGSITTSAESTRSTDLETRGC